VHKSSIYLPDDLKRALSDLAGRSGRSEADLIRQAIERLLAVSEPAPSEPVSAAPYPRPALVGVGVGPGDPGLVTARARATLVDADRVVVIGTDLRSVGRAEMVVRSVAPVARVQRISFAIAGGPDARHASLVSLADAVIAALDATELVTLAVIGDPLQWTIFPDLAARVSALRPTVTIAVEPGVTSYQAAAAATVTPLGRSGTPLVVADDTDDLDHHLGNTSHTVVLYKASTDAATLKAIAGRHDRHDVLLAELIGLPGQRVIDLDDTDDGPISYLATVMFPATDGVAAGAST
jgi:precorrin-2/cobalt-factor-2 C20-methyltransferase